MKRLLLAGAAVALAVAVLTLSERARAQLTPPRPAPAQPVQLSENGKRIAACITAAADVHQLPPAVLVILLNVEGGSLGRTSQNTNDTVDIGPMQVNQIWVPQVAAHWRATPADTFRALRDDFCANVEAGAWILRKGLDEARGDFWQGVGYYHSHDPGHKAAYLQSVLKQVLRFQKAAATHPVASLPPPEPQASPQASLRPPAVSRLSEQTTPAGRPFILYADGR